MKLIRILHDGAPRYGLLSGETVRLVDGDIFAAFATTGETRPLAGARILPPVQPSKIVAVGLNYRDHAEEFGEPIPAEPKIFLKPATAVIGPGDDIVCPPMSERVDFEAELGIVIKKTCRNVEPDEARGFVLGYTCVNDVTARDLQARDGQWTRAKGFDTFAPIGPVIATDVDPDALDVRLLQNGDVRQHSNTNNFIFPADVLVSFLSKVMTLLPGDVITTGTPSGVGPVQPGDRIAVVIEGIGALENGVRRG